MTEPTRILLIVTGGIAAYKSLDLVRRLRERGARVRSILTPGGSEMVTPLALAALSGEKVYQDLFSLIDESEMGHIRLARDADLVVVAPATADFLAKMATGLADDLATTVLLATTAPVLVAPAMNVQMWAHPATQRNVDRLRSDGIHFIDPGSGDLACGEEGPGRLAEPADIVGAIETLLAQPKPLHNIRALVTSGPTIEPIDPVRYFGNRSSGKQGHAIAGALARRGAEVTLVTGPSVQPPPPVACLTQVETAEEMLAACREALPADIAVCVAAVADWRVKAVHKEKLSRRNGQPPRYEMEENPDILAQLSQTANDRPRLVVGFAAETEDVVDRARAKRERKQCDWIVANDVSDDRNVFGSDSNTVHLITSQATETWPRLSKEEVADRLAERIADALVEPAARP